ncbi:MAG: beta-lactamase family protein [Microthrixaceae bacterium]|nr:beta-lactamase family protein [Microthrixaceae bacterium]
MHRHESRHGRSLRAAPAALLCAAAMIASGCSDPSSSAVDDQPDASVGPSAEQPASQVTAGPGSTGTFPGDDWETVSAEDAGMDPAVLAEVAAAAEAGGSNCLVVTRDGRLVDEWYWNDTGPDSTQEVFSASKSFTDVLVGIAADDGDLSVTDKASKWIPEWSDTPSDEVTVEHLLNNTSGRYHDLATDYGQMAVQAPDKTAFAIGLDQEAEPGTTWVYNNSAIQTLEAVLSGATGEDMADFAQDRLFTPLGMDDSGWARDPAGNPMAFIGVRSTCRDMARFGLMALNHGDWDGQQVVSAEWMEQSTGESSQDLNAAYGWLWWLNRKGPVLGPETASGGAVTPADSQLVAGAPEDMFFALGLGGQIIAIDPTTRTVVTRLGPSTYPPDTVKFTTDDAARVTTEAIIEDPQN